MKLIITEGFVFNGFSKEYYYLVELIKTPNKSLIAHGLNYNKNSNNEYIWFGFFYDNLELGKWLEFTRISYYL